MMKIDEMLEEVAAGRMTDAEAIAARPAKAWRAYELGRSASDDVVAAYWRILGALPPKEAPAPLDYDEEWQARERGQMRRDGLIED